MESHVAPHGILRMLCQATPRLLAYLTRSLAVFHPAKASFKKRTRERFGNLDAQTWYAARINEHLCHFSLVETPILSALVVSVTPNEDRVGCRSSEPPTTNALPTSSVIARRLYIRVQQQRPPIFVTLSDAMGSSIEGRPALSVKLHVYIVRQKLPPFSKTRRYMGS